MTETHFIPVTETEYRLIETGEQTFALVHNDPKTHPKIKTGDVVHVYPVEQEDQSSEQLVRYVLSAHVLIPPEPDPSKGLSILSLAKSAPVKSSAPEAEEPEMLATLGASCRDMLVSNGYPSEAVGALSSMEAIGMCHELIKQFMQMALDETASPIIQRGLNQMPKPRLGLN